MFAARYFASRFFAARYFAPVGSNTELTYILLTPGYSTVRAI